ncbi:DNA repair protein RadA, partial [Staphylococcus aureus]|uniref:DnaB-like helicase C-terminal domain-containing protein n=1 Tax=Staphylococcus aureus TaxID=1280 RepID=UPI001CF4567F
RIELYKKLFEKKIPTGFSNLDYVLKGGLAKKKIALIAALSGYGKTTMLTNLSSNMVREGYNVLHISLEEIDAEQMLRFDKIMSGMSGKDILKGLNDTNEGLRSVYNTYNRYEDT